MTRRFEGLTVLITGAAGGFGSRTAEHFAKQGARLVLSDLDGDALSALASRLDAETALLQGDVGKEDLHRQLVALAHEKFGALHVAINNAGIVHGAAKLHQIDSGEARRVIDIDLMGVFYAMKHQLEAMERAFRRDGTRAAIVNIASVAGIAGAPRLSAYAAAKHGVMGLTRSAAVEYAGKGIRVNAVCPSYARTPMATDVLMAGAGDMAAAEAEMTRGVPMRRLAEVDEIVAVILFAADPANSFMTGQALAADGGITAV